MDTKLLENLLKEYNSLNNQISDINTQAWNCEGPFSNLLRYSSDWYAHKDYLFRPLQERQESIQKQIYKLGNKVELTHPETIFGVRVVTRSFGKIDFVSCDTLDKIRLSDTKQEGTIQTPFTFLPDGSAIRSTEQHEYKVKRVGNVVFWVLGSKDSLYNFYNIF